VFVIQIGHDSTNGKLETWEPRLKTSKRRRCSSGRTSAPKRNYIQDFGKGPRQPTNAAYRAGHSHVALPYRLAESIRTSSYADKQDNSAFRPATVYAHFWRLLSPTLGRHLSD